VLQSLDAQLVYPENGLYLDYIAGQGKAASFFSHPPLGFEEALASRRQVEYPREEVCDLLQEYNAGLQAESAALAGIEALRSPAAFCVISGQQAGFLGGPVYTLYKITTTIWLAHYLERHLKRTVVPAFWLASEDHDFAEINHAFLLKRDGEVGRVSFEWTGQGRPITDLPISDEVLSACRAYFDQLPHGSHYETARQLYAAKPEEDYCSWHARIWSRLFSGRGLVVVDPSILRAPARAFFHAALTKRKEIQAGLEAAAARLREAGYDPALSPQRAGRLYTLDSDGRRIRVEDPRVHLASVQKAPERYSADAALRPLLADTLFPVVASVLGPGEIAYHAMLKPIYSLFSLPQPVVFPRKSYTVVAREEGNLISRCETGVAEILAGEFDPKQCLRRLTSHRLREQFETAREGISRSLEPLQPPLAGLDPGLQRTWQQTRVASLRGLDNLEKRAVRAELARRGLSASLLQRLQNALRPRGRLQERVFPAPHFINRHGASFVDTLFSIGEMGDFSHQLIPMEEENGRR